MIDIIKQASRSGTTVFFRFIKTDKVCPNFKSVTNIKDKGNHT